MSGNAFGQRLLQLRVQAGRTQEQQADAINTVSGRGTMTRREISRYETGQNIPTNHTITHIAIACGLPPDQLKQEAAAARADRRKSSAREEQELIDMRRRTILAGPAIGAAAASEPWARLAHALTKESRLDSHSVAALTERAGALHVSENHLTAQQLQRNVVTHLDTITDALACSHTHQSELSIAAGETAALAGWIAWDLGNHQAAHSYYQVTLDCARAAGHPQLRALALTYASYGASAPARRIELLAEAATYVRGPGNAAAAAWIHGRHAEEMAAVGETTSALRALDRARVAYEYADPMVEQAWVQFMSPARMDALALSVLGQLAHPELEEVAAAATRRLGGELSDAGVVILGDLATALLRGSDNEQGVHVARKFATAAAARPNTMGRVRALAIAGHLPDREHELAAQLRELAA
ncbi:helix-turn-helix transcriptional regulator [Streptomyces sp. NBC_01298]|uniref:helix-turn-helix domain-containing protein n=1 Tax=Streptomyces sp. NBC_01298 TaxID=2903817 RepID=UPI002E0E4231|nr:helix-turn-helix transcriptional regulator [Streptomyces sp. NBC_01298]